MPDFGRIHATEQGTFIATPLHPSASLVSLFRFACSATPVSVMTNGVSPGTMGLGKTEVDPRRTTP